MTAVGDAAAFDRLAPPLQRWLWERGWTGLRDAQAAALPLILDGERDVVVAAATASGMLTVSNFRTNLAAASWERGDPVVNLVFECQA